MSSIFNENKFIRDYKRLMSAQKPSAALKQHLLDRMRLECAQGQPSMDVNKSSFDFGLPLPVLKTVPKTRKLWQRVAALAAVFILVIALYLIYPIVMKSFRGDTDTVKEMAAGAPAIADVAAEAPPADKRMLPESNQDLDETQAFNVEAAEIEGEDKPEAGSKLADSLRNQDKNLLMYLENPVLSLEEANSKALRRLVISNYDEQTYIFGLGIHLQRMDERGEWNTLDLPEDFSWIEVAYELPAVKASGEASVYEETIDLAALFTEAAPGLYRIVRTVGEHSLAAEFEILP